MIPNLPVGGLHGAAAPFPVGLSESTPTFRLGNLGCLFTQSLTKWVWNAVSGRPRKSDAHPLKPLALLRLECLAECRQAG